MTESDIQAQVKRIEAAKNILRAFGIEPTPANLRKPLKQLVREVRGK